MNSDKNRSPILLIGSMILMLIILCTFFFVTRYKATETKDTETTQEETSYTQEFDSYEEEGYTNPEFSEDNPYEDGDRYNEYSDSHLEYPEHTEGADYEDSEYLSSENYDGEGDEYSQPYEEVFETLDDSEIDQIRLEQEYRLEQIDIDLDPYEEEELNQQDIDKITLQKEFESYEKEELRLIEDIRSMNDDEIPYGLSKEEYIELRVDEYKQTIPADSLYGIDPEAFEESGDIPDENDNSDEDDI